MRAPRRVPWARLSPRAPALGAAGALVLLAACSRAAPPSPPAPEPAAAPAATATFAPGAASGSYLLRTTFQGSPGSGQRPPRRGAAAREGSNLRLDATPLAAPLPGVQATTQFTAAITLAGYSRSPRGRTGQVAAWWPIPGDSLVIQFPSARGNASIQLRGARQGQSLSGDIWYISTATGTAFQLGTFTARKN
jgi:hypothetical protein